MLKRIQALDDRVLMWFARRHTPVMNKLMILITTTGDNGYIWFALAVPFLLMNRWRLTGFTVLAAMGIASLTGEITIKHIVRRVRPCKKAFDEYLLIENPPHYSFPSGHTSASFAVATVMGCMCPLWLALAVGLYAFLIAFSRLYLLVHYPTDVLAGMMIGTICGFIAIPVAQSIPLFTIQF
ncbi:MAG: phosphatase PAP2 family protein [Acutalibacteraceae bacterium]|nr:phosphatase PAP2 family protein [Clostridia bacterium]MEE3403204.1 phosphatase PAP2 family protein [Acutalibacteraceae bacterium]